jgi:hypothetical protein
LTVKIAEELQKKKKLNGQDQDQPRNKELSVLPHHHCCSNKHEYKDKENVDEINEEIGVKLAEMKIDKDDAHRRVLDWVTKSGL